MESKVTAVLLCLLLVGCDEPWRSITPEQYDTAVLKCTEVNSKPLRIFFQNIEKGFRNVEIECISATGTIFSASLRNVSPQGKIN